MGDRAAKDALFDAFAEVAKALGNGRRAELVDVLAQGERHVEELAGRDRPERRQHLAITCRSCCAHGLVAHPPRRHPHLLPPWPSSASASCGRRCATSPRPPRRRARRAAPPPTSATAAALEQISRDELARRLATATSSSLDVRPAAEYAAGHIAGARSIPIDELAASFASLPTDVDVVAYCRGPYCVFADDAVRLLRRRGYRAAPARGRLPRSGPRPGCPSRPPAAERPAMPTPL